MWQLKAARNRKPILWGREPWNNFSCEKASHPPKLWIFYEENKSIQMPKEKKKHLKDGKCWREPASGTCTFDYQSSRELAICKASRICQWGPFFFLASSLKWWFLCNRKCTFFPYYSQKHVWAYAYPLITQLHTVMGSQVIYTYKYDKMFARSSFPKRAASIPW